jgi:O-antigen ligase
VFLVTSMQVATTVALFPDAPRTGSLVNAIVSAAMLLALVVLIAFGAVRARLPRPRPEMLAAIALVGWFGASLGWTESTSVGAAAGYWLQSVFEVTTVWLLAGMSGPATFLLRSVQGYVVGTTVVLAYVLVRHLYTPDGRLGNLEFLHPNTLGFRLAVAAIFATYLATSRESRSSMARWSRPLWAAFALLTVVGLAMSLSKTAIAAFLGGLLVLFLRREMSAVGRAAALLAGMAIVLGSSGMLASYWESYAGGQATSLDTLSGRTDIWAATWPMLAEHPIIGHGILSFRDIGPQVAEVRLVHAHDEALQLLFAGGWIALVLTAVTYGGLLLRMRTGALRLAQGEPSFRPLVLALGVFVLLRGITEASDSTVLYPLPLLFAFGAWSARRRPQPAVEPVPSTPVPLHPAFRREFA